MRAQINCIILLTVCLIFNSNLKAQKNPIDYLGQGIPGYYSTEFASEILDGIKEYNFNFSPDGDELYFAGYYNGEYTIKYMERIEGVWSERKLASFCSTETGVEEASPCFSPDGNTLFYLSNRSDGLGSWDIWYVERTPNGWSEPINPGSPLNSEGFEDYPFLADDGSFYFNSDRSGGFGDMDIYQSTFINGQFDEVVNLGGEINSELFDESPVVIGDHLFFGIRDHHALYRCNKVDGEWSNPSIVSGGSLKSGNYYSLRLTPDSKYIIYCNSGSIQWVDKKAFDYLGVKEPPFNYISSWYAGIDEQMELALHPKLKKRRVTSATSTSETGYNWMINNTSYGEIDDIREGVMDISILHQNQNTACVKVFSNNFFDYLQLARYGSQWKIINVLWEYHGTNTGGSQEELEQTIQNYVSFLKEGDSISLAGIIHNKYVSRFALSLDNVENFSKTEILEFSNQQDNSDIFNNYEFEILDIVNGTACARVSQNDSIEYIDFTYQNNQWFILNSLRNYNLEPIELSLSNSSIINNEPIGALVGLLSLEDIPEDCVYQFSISDSAGFTFDNSSFTISGNELLSNHVFTLSDEPYYTVYINALFNDALEIKKRFLIYHDSSVGLSNDDMEDSFLVYLDQSNHFIGINTTLPINSDIKYKLYDINGQLILHDQFKGSKINIGELKKGCYVLSILYQNQRISEKIMVY